MGWKRLRCWVWLVPFESKTCIWYAARALWRCPRHVTVMIDALLVFIYKETAVRDREIIQRSRRPPVAYKQADAGGGGSGKRGWFHYTRTRASSTAAIIYGGCRSAAAESASLPAVEVLAEEALVAVPDRVPDCALELLLPDDEVLLLPDDEVLLPLSDREDELRVTLWMVMLNGAWE